MLKVSKLKKYFGGVKAVNGCSFEVEKGKITALVGPNGAGKTTVFNMVSGMIAMDEGSVVFNGHELNKLPAWKRARAGISRTFQLSRLFKNLSIKDNLLLALRNDDDQFWKMFLRGEKGDQEEERQVKEIMDFIGLDKDPETIVTDLSYGQQKLFDLSRALINPHTFLMLDEPVAGINPVLRERLKKILKDLKEKGETILLIEHDMDFVRAVADHVIVLDQGKVLAQGIAETVLSDEKVLEAYLGTAV